MKYAVPVLLALFAVFLQSSRADVAVGLQDYIVLGRESQVRTVMNQYRDVVDNNVWDNSASATFPSMASRVAITASADDQYFIYDHWEDGYETMPNVPFGFVPDKPSTLVFKLARGQTVTFDSSLSGGSTACTPSAFATMPTAACQFDDGTPAQPQFADLSTTPTNTTCTYTCSLVELPRVNTSISFDGGDAIRSFGGPATLVHQGFPSTSPSSQDTFLGAALEHFSLQAMAGFLSYRVPVGESTDTTPSPAAVDNNPFYFARAMVVAFSDNTLVTVNNGATQVTFTLNRGQSYATSMLDNTGATINETPAPNIKLVAGTRIDSDKEVAVAIVNAGSSANHTDMEAVIPVRAYGRDFVVPTGGMGASMKLYLFNPNTTQTTVNVYQNGAGGGITPFVIGPNGSTGHILPGTANNADDERPKAARVTSSLPIWGLAVHDWNAGGYDYSFSLIPTRFLTSEYVIPFTPSSGGTSDEGSAVYIAPVFDDTRVYITYPEGTPGNRSLVDINGDGVVGPTDCDAAAGAYGCTTGDPGYTLRTYSPGPPIYDPWNSAHRNSAMKLFAGSTTTGLTSLAGTTIVADKPIAVVFGPDGTVANGGGNNVDLGFAIVPPSALFIGELLSVDISLNPGVIGVSGSTGSLTVAINVGLQDIADPIVRLTLAPDFPLQAPPVLLIGATGVTGFVSTPGDPTTWSFDLGAAGFALLDSDSTLVGTLDLQSTPSIDDTELIKANAQGSIGGYDLNPTASLTVHRTPLQLTLSAPARADANSTLQYTIQATNTGVTNLTNVVVKLPLPEGLLAPTGPIVAAGWTCSAIPASNELSCLLTGPLVAGVPASLTLTANTQALPGGALVTTRAQGTIAESLFVSVSPDVTTEIGVPDWEISVVVTPAVVVRGQTTSPEVSILNASASPATNAVVRLPIPTGTTYVASSLEIKTGVSYVPCTATVTATFVECAVGSVAPTGTVLVRMSLGTSAAFGDFSIPADIVSTETPSGRTSSAARFSVIPAAPTITAPSMNAIVAPSFTVTGAGETGDTVTVTIGMQTFTGTVIAGAYSVNVGPLSNGVQTISVTQKDSANKSSAAASVDVTVDLTPPAIAITAPTGGLIAPSFTITGTAEVGSTVELEVSGAPYSPVVLGNGTWSQMVGPLSDGAILISATATDTYGNESAPVSVTVVVDTTPPVGVVVTSPRPGATVPTTFEVRGRGEGNARITVVVGGVTYTTTANTNGNFSLIVSSVPLGAQQISVVQRDGAGLDSAPVLVDVNVIDAAADFFPPDPPVIIAPATGSTTPGEVVTVSGTSEPGTTVTVTIGGSTVTTTANDDGSYAVDVPGPFADGPSSVTVVATDAAGNSSDPTVVNFNIGVTSGNGGGEGEGNTAGEEKATNAEDTTVVLGGVAGCSCGAGAPPDASFLVLAAVLITLRLRRAARKRQ